jgi:hypothetical protein
MSESRSSSSLIIRRLALLVILLLALFFRLYRLDSIPPGLTHDEADTGYFAKSVYCGQPSQVEAPYGYAYQPFTKYSGALFMALFGPNDLALRLHSAFFGMVLLIFTYLWARHLFGEVVGLGAAALIALSFWTVCDSRFALNSAPAPALFTAATYFLWRALDDGNEWAWGLFALLLSASLYVYEAALAASAALVLLFIYLLLCAPSRFRSRLVWFAGALVLVALLAAPHLLDSSAWGRSRTLSGPLQAAIQGDLGPLLSNCLSALGTFSIRGDTFVTYNLPGRPIFDPVVSLFFYAGIALCLYRWREPAYAFVLMWLVMGITPSLILGEWTSTLHSKAAEAPIMTLPALGAVEVGRTIASRFGRRWVRLFAAGCVAWLGVVAASTGYDYFVRWGQSPETRAAYFHNLAAITDYLNETEHSGPVALSSPFPDLPLNPFIAGMRLRQRGCDPIGASSEPSAIRWFDARRALVFPAPALQAGATPNAADGLFILPSSTPLAPYFARCIDLQRIERVQLRPDDVAPYFDVFVWSPNDSLTNFLSSTSANEALQLPVNFGGAVELLAYDLPAKVAPGDTITLATTWRVLDPDALGAVPSHRYGRAVVIFAHLLNADGDIVAQEDRLDAPAWNWHTGDVFVQLHHLSSPPDVPSISHRLVPAIGLYDPDDFTRLPILSNVSEAAGGGVDDRLLLPPLELIDR